MWVVSLKLWENPSLQLILKQYFLNLVAKYTQPSTKAREIVYIKVTHVLENHVRTFSPPCRNKWHRNSSDLVFFQRWKIRHFTCCFSTHKKYSLCRWRKILKSKGNSGIILPQPCFETVRWACSWGKGQRIFVSYCLLKWTIN